MNSIETERLILRQWQEDDLDDFAEMMADPLVAKFTTLDRKAQDRDMAWRTMTGSAGHIALRGWGLWAVEHKDSGKVIGRVGPHHPEGWPGLEVGWALNRNAWGQGFAAEAAAASMMWTFATFPDLDRIIHLIVEENEPSIALAERVGSQWKDQEMVQLLGFDVRIYSQTRAEFAARWG